MKFSIRINRNKSKVCKGRNKSTKTKVAMKMSPWICRNILKCFVPLYTMELLGVCVSLSLSHVWLFETPWTVACQAPQSMGFPRQEFWSGLPFSPPEDLPDPGIEPTAPVLVVELRLVWVQILHLSVTTCANFLIWKTGKISVSFLTLLWGLY